MSSTVPCCDVARHDQSFLPHVQLADAQNNMTGEESLREENRALAEQVELERSQTQSEIAALKHAVDVLRDNSFTPHVDKVCLSVSSCTTHKPTWSGCSTC